MTVVTTDPSGWVVTLVVVLKGDGSVEAPLVDDVLDTACTEIGAITLAELGKIEPMLSLMRVSLSGSAWEPDMDLGAKC